MRLLILGLLLLTGPTSNGQTKFGYIDYEKVASEFHQNPDRQKEIEKRTKQFNDSLKILYDKFQDFIKGDYPRSVVSDTAFMKKLEVKLQKLQVDIIDYQQYAKNEIKKINEKWDLNLRKIILNELNQFSSDSNVTCVADRKSILYCEDCKDFTDDFIAYHKKRRR